MGSLRRIENEYGIFGWESVVHFVQCGGRMNLQLYVDPGVSLIISTQNPMATPLRDKYPC